MGVGAECQDDDACLHIDGEPVASCLDLFKGGYCGLEGCANHEDCPSGSACVAHSDGQNYCFRICADKAQCHRNRSLAKASNCSANIAFLGGRADCKACVPPSG